MTTKQTTACKHALAKALTLRPRVSESRTLATGDTIRLVAGEHGDYAVYSQNNQMHCTCEAGQNGAVCYHRAAVKLVELADAFLAALDASIESQRQAAKRERALLQTAQEIVWIGGLPLKAS